MKNFLPTFLAVLVAAGLALFVYDRFVLAPRLEKVSETAQVNLADAREQANQIATELDASVERSVADAKTAFDEQAKAEDERRAELEKQAEQMKATAQAADALARASVVKVALVEYYMSMGQWPTRTTDIGMGQPEDFAGGPVAAISLEPEGVIAIRLKPEVAVGAQLRLVPRVARSGMVEWSCRASNYASAERLPACRP
jgi:hypothetical protein